jgi:hypothetical protein
MLEGRMTSEIVADCLELQPITLLSETELRIADHSRPKTDISETMLST